MSSPHQTTLSKSATLTGSALHTGGNVTLTLRPAPVGHGRKFRRKDLPDEPVIDAHIGNVKTVERATTIGEGSVKVHTVEHVLSALAGMEVDNVLIEMDSNEPPIGDGSARPYVELIQQAGIETLPASRPVFEVTEPIHVETKSGSLMMLVPDSAFRVSCTNVGPDGRFTQFYSTEVNPAAFVREIAPARTFVFYEDVRPLMEKGLIKGGSLENAIVVRGDSVLSKEPLRYPDEFVRHKILDIIGDLALFGRSIRGHVIAIKPGHGANAELTRALSKLHAKAMALVPPATIPKGEVMEIADVMRVLPHRYPFLMVDRVITFESEKRCVGVKQVTINEWYFTGHFPGHPVMPGVLQLEAMAQVGSIILLGAAGLAGKIGYFMSADAVKFRKPVSPGDTLFIDVEMTQRKRGIAKAKGRCLVNNEVVSEAEMMFGIVDL